MISHEHIYICVCMNQTLVCNSCLFVRQSFADRLDSRASVIENPGKLPIYDFIHPTQTIKHRILDLKGRLIAGDVATVVQQCNVLGTSEQTIYVVQACLALLYPL